MTPTRSTNNIDRLNHKHRTQSFFLVTSYLPEMWSSLSPYLVQSRYRQALFSRSRDIASSWPSHVFANVPMLSHREGPKNVYPSLGWVNPTLDPCASTNTFAIPETTFIITLLRCDVWCHQSTTTVSVINMISWSEDLDTSFISYSILNLVTRYIATLNMGVSVTSCS